MIDLLSLVACIQLYITTAWQSIAIKSIDVLIVGRNNHSFSQQAYLEGQAEVIENSLWAVIRFIQERIDVLQHMAEAQRTGGRQGTADAHEQKAEQLKAHVLNIRRFIVSGTLNTAMHPGAEALDATPDSSLWESAKK
jgi:hypothetical protein